MNLVLRSSSLGKQWFSNFFKTHLNKLDHGPPFDKILSQGPPSDSIFAFRCFITGWNSMEIIFYIIFYNFFFKLFFLLRSHFFPL